MGKVLIGDDCGGYGVERVNSGFREGHKNGGMGGNDELAALSDHVLNERDKRKLVFGGKSDFRLIKEIEARWGKPGHK